MPRNRSSRERKAMFAKMSKPTDIKSATKFASQERKKEETKHRLKVIPLKSFQVEFDHKDADPFDIPDNTIVEARNTAEARRKVQKDIGKDFKISNVCPSATAIQKPGIRTEIADFAASLLEQGTSRDRAIDMTADAYNIPKQSVVNIVFGNKPKKN